MATTAAIVARARRRIVSHFMANNAVTPPRAIYFSPERGIQRRMLGRLLKLGILVEPAPENYYLDVPAYERWREAFRLRFKLVFLVVALVAIGMAVG